MKSLYKKIEKIVKLYYLAFFFLIKVSGGEFCSLINTIYNTQVNIYLDFGEKILIIHQSQK